MVRCSTAKDIATLLANRLAEHFQWHHVAIFQAVESENIFRLLAEVSDLDRGELPIKDQTQSIRAGVLGKVYQTGTPVNSPDLYSDDDLRTIFVKGWEGIQSVLCLPIVWDQKVQWLLDVEDERTSAFSKDDEEDLAIILGEAALIIGKLSAQYLLESVFQKSSDSVFFTDTRSVTVGGNPAAVALLGYRDAKQLTGPFKRVFKDKVAGRRIVEATATAPTEVELLRGDGTSVSVLISGSALPEELSRKVFVAKDLTLVKRVQQLETLQKVFPEIALQSHTPLALAGTWIRDLKSRVESEEVSELCTKVLGQLRKTEISYDRLALHLDCESIVRRTEKQRLDLGVELKRTIEEFPALESQRIKLLPDPGELPYLSLDPGQISFIFASLLGYLIRFSIPDEDVTVRFEVVPEAIKIVFGARLPTEPDNTQRDPVLDRVKFDMALGDSTIRKFAANNSASYRSETGRGQATFELSFQLPRGDS